MSISSFLQEGCNDAADCDVAEDVSTHPSVFWYLEIDFLFCCISTMSTSSFLQEECNDTADCDVAADVSTHLRGQLVL